MRKAYFCISSSQNPIHLNNILAAGLESELDARKETAEIELVDQLAIQLPLQVAVPERRIDAVESVVYRRQGLVGDVRVTSTDIRQVRRIPALIKVGEAMQA